MAATPAIAALAKAGISHEVHRYTHDSRNDAYGAEAVEAMGTALGVAPAQVFKTLVISLTGGANKLAVAVLPVPQKLSLKAAAAALGASKATMAQAADATRATGYVLGGVSPLGQRSTLPTVIDASAWEWDSILVSAGRRGLEVQLAPTDLVNILSATTADICS